jgi:hypothetical protein
MDIDTLLAERDPARRRPLPGPDSAESIALYRKIVQPGSVAGPARGPRRRIMIGAVTGAAAASAIGLTLGLLPGGAQTAGSRPSGGRPAGSSPTAIDAHLTAKQVLDRAAASAMTEPTVIPRPDQFVYAEFPGANGQSTQIWLSVDGSRNGLVRGYFEGGSGTTTMLGCANGEHKVRLPGYNGKPYHGDGKPSKKPVPLDGPVVTESCMPQPAFYPGMPTTATAMPAFLENKLGVRLNDLNDLAKTVGEFFSDDYYLLPGQRAALYEYLATTPGLIIERNLRGTDGSKGVGIGWSSGALKGMLVFDPGNYTLLAWITPGQAWSAHAPITPPTIVDQVGQVP